MSESLTTKISLGVVVLISFLFMGIIVYERMRIENSVEQKQQQLKVYKNQGLGLLNSEKNRLEKQLNSPARGRQGYKRHALLETVFQDDEGGRRSA